MNCPECAAPFGTNDRYCGECGARKTRPVEAEHAEANSPTSTSTTATRTNTPVSSARDRQSPAGSIRLMGTLILILVLSQGAFTGYFLLQNSPTAATSSDTERPLGKEKPAVEPLAHSSVTHTTMTGALRTHSPRPARAVTDTQYSNTEAGDSNPHRTNDFAAEFREIDEKYLRLRKLQLNCDDQSFAEIEELERELERDLEDLIRLSDPDVARQLDKLDRTANYSDAEWIAEFKKLQSALPNSAFLIHRIGEKVFFAKQQFEDAAECYRRAAELHPDNTFFLMDLAWLQFDLGQLDEAERLFRTLDGRHPEDRSVTLGLVSTLLSRKKFDQAEETARKQLSLNPSGEAWDHLGMALLLKNELFDAEVAFRKAINACEGNDTYPRLHLAFCLIDQGKIEGEAEEILARSSPDEPWLQAHIAQLFFDRNDAERVSKHLSNALRSWDWSADPAGHIFFAMQNLDPQTLKMKSENIGVTTTQQLRHR